MNIPDNLKYTKTHEWIKIEGDMAICGITDYAQSELSDIVFVNLKNKGTVISKGEVFGTVEGVKAVSDVYLPVSGEVIEINSELANAPQSINEDPYNKGWMVKIKITNKGEINDLLSSAAYNGLICK